MGIVQIIFLSIPSLLLVLVGFIIFYTRNYPDTTLAKQVLHFLQLQKAEEGTKDALESKELPNSDGKQVEEEIQTENNPKFVPVNRDRVKKSVEKDPLDIDTASTEPDGEQTIFIDRFQNVHVLSKKDVEIKKEKSRELYYKKLYEEVTKFNISTENLDYESLQLLADSYGKIGNKEEALKIYELALSRATQTILKDKIITLFSMGAYPDVIKSFKEYEQKFLEEDYKQDDFSIIGIFGKCFYYMHDYDKGLEVFESLLDKPNISKDIIYSVAMSYEAKEDFEKSLLYYEKIFDMDTDYRDIKIKINQISKKMKS